MRAMFSAILAIALGLLPVAAARADATPEPSAGMSCHQMMGEAGDRNSDQAPAHSKQDCADHCLSQVNGQTMEAPLPGPSLVNAIRAELGGQLDLGKVHFRDPPDPPPPRS